MVLISFAVLGGYFLRQKSAKTEQPPLNRDNLTWPDAVEYLNAGGVKSATQTHALKVFLELDDGSRFQTTEPEIDAIFEAVRKCGAPCEGIMVATE